LKHRQENQDHCHQVNDGRGNGHVLPDSQDKPSCQRQQQEDSPQQNPVATHIDPPNDHFFHRMIERYVEKKEQQVHYNHPERGSQGGFSPAF